MRISTSTIYELGVTSINQQTAAWIKTQQQVASQRRILTPSDDPVAAARVLEVSQAKAINEQYDVNMNTAASAMGLEEAVLTSVDNLIVDVKLVAINAGHGDLDAPSLNILANNLLGRYQELLGLANSTDGNGLYMFSGYKSSTTPFSETSPGNVGYSGDQGQRLMQISQSRQIAVSDAGSDVFMQIKNGNGTFVAAAAAGNTGTGTISAGNLLSPTAWNSAANNKDFTLKFDVNAGVTTYDIVDNVSGNSLLTGAAPAAAPYPRTYTAGSTISLKSQGAEPAFDYGAELNIGGAPATGDTFSVKASTNQSLFTTLNNLITDLKAAAVSGNKTALTNNLTSAFSSLENSLDHVLTVHGSLGARMQEIDAVRNSGDDMALQYDTTLSGLQDLDYAKAITDLTKQQTNLEAAQKSFLKIQGLSLFNFIN